MTIPMDRPPAMPALRALLLATGVEMSWGRYDLAAERVAVRFSLGDVFANVGVSREELDRGDVAEYRMIAEVKKLVEQSPHFTPFPAKYPGRCISCERRFGVGDSIRLASMYGESESGRVYRHETCPPDEDETDGAPLCSSCFTYHRGECI